MIGADERLGLQFVNQGVGAIQLPRRLGAVPPAVEPDAADLPVIRQQLSQLTVHVVDIAGPLACLRPLRIAAGAPTRKVIAVMPVELRAIEGQIESLSAALPRGAPH